MAERFYLAYMESPRVLQAIEDLVADDFCEEMSMRAADGEVFSSEERVMLDKLNRIYRLAHSWNPTHECFPVHSDWRAELGAVEEPGRPRLPVTKETADSNSAGTATYCTYLCNDLFHEHVTAESARACMMGANSEGA